MDRLLQLSRLRFQSGNIDEALLDTWCVVNPGEAKVNGRPGVFLAVGEGEPAQAMVMASMAAGRSEGWKTKVNGLLKRPGSHDLVAGLEDLVSTYTNKTAADFLNAAQDLRIARDPSLGWLGIARNSRDRWFGHLLDKLGEAARQAIAVRLERKDPFAVRCVLWTHFFDLIPLVEAYPKLPGPNGDGDARGFALEVLRFRQRFAK